MQSSVLDPVALDALSGVATVAAVSLPLLHAAFLNRYGERRIAFAASGAVLSAACEDSARRDRSDVPRRLLQEEYTAAIALRRMFDWFGCGVGLVLSILALAVAGVFLADAGLSIRSLGRNRDVLAVCLLAATPVVLWISALIDSTRRWIAASRASTGTAYGQTQRALDSTVSVDDRITAGQRAVRLTLGQSNWARFALATAELDLLGEELAVKHSPDVVSMQDAMSLLWHLAEEDTGLRQSESLADGVAGPPELLTLAYALERVTVASVDNGGSLAVGWGNANYTTWDLLGDLVVRAHQALDRVQFEAGVHRTTEKHWVQTLLEIRHQPVRPETFEAAVALMRRRFERSTASVTVWARFLLVSLANPEEDENVAGHLRWLLSGPDSPRGPDINLHVGGAIYNLVREGRLTGLPATKEAVRDYAPQLDEASASVRKDSEPGFAELLDD